MLANYTGEGVRTVLFQMEKLRLFARKHENTLNSHSKSCLGALNQRLWMFCSFGHLQIITTSVFFFSCVKTKSVRETFFWPFFEFFHAQKIAFTHTFLQVFTYGENFSRALFMIFSRMDFVFSRGEFRYFSKFSRMGFVFFTGKKWRIPIKGLFTYYVLFWLGVDGEDTGIMSSHFHITIYQWLMQTLIALHVFLRQLAHLISFCLLVPALRISSRLLRCASFMCATCRWPLILSTFIQFYIGLVLL